jgi:hypothetical protein
MLKLREELASAEQLLERARETAERLIFTSSRRQMAGHA